VQLLVAAVLLVVAWQLLMLWVAVRWGLLLLLLLLVLLLVGLPVQASADDATAQTLQYAYKMIIKA
jgi:hypothetical protein